MIEEAPYTDVLNIRKEVMYPDKDINYVTLADDDNGLHLGYYEQGILIGVVSLFLKEKTLQFRKLAIKKEHQGKGYGTKIIQWILDYANDVKLEKVWCNARVEKAYFYEKFGFQNVSETFRKGDYEYIVVEKNISENQ